MISTKMAQNGTQPKYLLTVGSKMALNGVFPQELPIVGTKMVQNGLFSNSLLLVCTKMSQNGLFPPDLLPHGSPIDQQMLLHAEAVGAAVGVQGVLLLLLLLLVLLLPVVPSCPGLLLILAVQVGELHQVVVPQRAEVPGLLAHARRVDHQVVLGRGRGGEERGERGGTGCKVGLSNSSRGCGGSLCALLSTFRCSLASLF